MIKYRKHRSRSSKIWALVFILSPDILETLGKSLKLQHCSAHGPVMQAK